MTSLRIYELQSALFSTARRLAKSRLAFMRALHEWEQSDGWHMYPTLREWWDNCAVKSTEMSFDVARDMLKVYRTFHVHGKVGEEKVASTPHSKLRTMIPMVQRRQITPAKAVNIANTRSKRDIRRLVNDSKPRITTAVADPVGPYIRPTQPPPTSSEVTPQVAPQPAPQPSVRLYVVTFPLLNSDYAPTGISVRRKVAAASVDAAVILAMRSKWTRQDMLGVFTAAKLAVTKVIPEGS